MSPAAIVSDKNSDKNQEAGSASAAQRFYRPELDCLRFFAFFAVFIHHTFAHEADYYAARHIPFGAFLASAARAGSFGVDLFFLLSAYLITELLLREREQFGSVHLRSFYVRRMLRIWPLYFLAVLIGAVLPLIDPNQTFPLRYIVAFLLLSGNWMTSLVGFPQSVMNPLWSVSFEEQFYLLWPALIAFARRAKTLLLASGLLLVVAEIGRMVLLKYAQQRHSDVEISTNTITRLDPLALGIATAVILRKTQLQLQWFLRLSFLALGVALWLFAGHYFHLTLAFMMIGYPAIALGSWLIFMSVYGIGVSPRWLRYLGKISYGLYVFHMLALYLADKLVGGYARNWGKFILYWWLGLAMTLLMASLSYRFYESPFLRLKERFAFVRSRPV
ncbi:MAG: acyltransferase family protein [Candidatus Sulfotelmatobacter sp.]